MVKKVELILTTLTVIDRLVQIRKVSVQIDIVVVVSTTEPANSTIIFGSSLFGVNLRN